MSCLTLLKSRNCITSLTIHSVLLQTKTTLFGLTCTLYNLFSLQIKTLLMEKIEETICPICRRCVFRLDRISALGCGHLVCDSCLKRFKDSCSYCRAPVKKIVPVHFGPWNKTMLLCSAWFKIWVCKLSKRSFSRLSWNLGYTKNIYLEKAWFF